MPFLGIALVIVFIEATGTRLLRYAWELGPVLPVVEGNALASLLAIAMLAAVWYVLYTEGVTGREIGLAVELAIPAVVAVGAYFLVLNAVGAGFALASGSPETIGYRWTVPPGTAILVFVWMLIVAGLVEEFVFRGYIQTKCIALLGDDRYRGVAGGIFLAGVLFSAYHIPRVLTGGTPAGLGATEYLAMLAINGVAFGILYEWTHNLFIPILIHAAGNMPGTAGILFFTTSGWATWAFFGYQLVYLGVIMALIISYRRWAGHNGWMPWWGSRTVGGERQ